MFCVEFCNASFMCGRLPKRQVSVCRASMISPSHSAAWSSCGNILKLSMQWMSLAVSKPSCCEYHRNYCGGVLSFSAWLCWCSNTCISILPHLSVVWIMHASFHLSAKFVLARAETRVSLLFVSGCTSLAASYSPLHLYTLQWAALPLPLHDESLHGRQAR